MNIKNIIIATFVSVFSFTLFSQQVFAQTPETEVLSDKSPYIEMGELVVITKPIESDAFLIGTEVKVDAPINGDLTVISTNAKINAPVFGNVKIISEFSEIKSEIQGSLSFLTSNLYISSTGDIQKDVYGIASKIVHDGRIGRNLNLAFSPQSDVNINGKIVGDMFIRDIRPNYGDNSVIQGEISKKEAPVTQEESNLAKILTKLLHSFILIALGALFYRLFNKWFKDINKQITTKTVYSSAFGLSVILLTPLTIIFLVLIMIGIPVAIIILCLLIIIYYISPIFVSYLIGNKILGKDTLPYLSLAIGVLVYDVVTLLPTLGFFINLTVFMITLGAIVSLLTVKNHENKIK